MIHIILGTKAQLIKMAPIMRRLQELHIPYNFILTGQHRETMDAMLADFGLKQPDVLLYHGRDIVGLSQAFGWFFRTAFKTWRRPESIFRGDKNGAVLVHGDTLSTLLGATISRLAGLTVGHVESGLRSFNLLHPFPEELTRRLVFRLSHILFCPDEKATANVRHLRKTIMNTGGNTMRDSLRLAQQLANESQELPPSPFGIVSIHRYENIFNRERLARIMVIITAAAQKYRLLFILHPPTRRQLVRYGLLDKLQQTAGLTIRDRYPYVAFTSVLAKCDFVITDGGSLQEETSYLGIPCLLLRQTTERREGLEQNVVLSKFDDRVINNFLTGFQQYRTEPMQPDNSPTAVIIDAIRGIS